MPRVKIEAGNISITVDGVDYTRRQVLALLDRVAALSALVSITEEVETDRPAVGFTAHLERAPDTSFYPPEEDE